MTIGSVEDRLGIRELCDTYAVAAMRKDVDLWASTWAEESSWNLPIFTTPLQGKQAIVPAFAERMQHVGVLSIIGFPVDLQVDGDTATGKYYCQEILFLTGDDKRKFIVGCFHDQYVKINGAWKIRARDYEVFGRA